MKNMTAKEGIDIRNLPLASITGAGYQRMFKPKKAQAIATDFHPEECGVLVVTDQGDGTYACTDGQHRLAALLANGYTEWPCQVMSVRELPAEARTFVDVNTKRTGLYGADAWRARRMAKDPVVLDVEDVAKSLGIVVEHGSHRSWRTLRATRSAERILSTYGRDHLAEVFRVAGNAWPEDMDAFKSEVILGLASFLAYYENDPVFHRSELVPKLARLPMATFLQRAGAYGKAGGGAGSTLRAWEPGVVKVIVEAYNHKRSTLLLEEPTLKGWRTLAAAKAKS